MQTKQTTFCLVTGILIAALGVLLSTLDPVGWHLMLVGLALCTLSSVSLLMQLRAPSPLLTPQVSLSKQVG